MGSGRTVRRLCALLAAGIALAAAGEVPPLSYDEFKKEVLGSDAMWLLSFHSPECFACEDFVPQLQDVADSVAQWGIRVGSVDCSEHKRVCEDANVVTAPTFKFYASPPQRNPYTRKRYRVPVDYTGTLEGKSLERFLLKNMHHSVQRVKTAEEFAGLLDRAKQAGRNVVVLFTERDQTSPLYKAASNAFAGGLEFAEVHSSIGALVEKYGIEALPTLGVISTADDQFHKFAGDSKDLDAIKAFLADYAAKPEPAAGDQSDGLLTIPVEHLQSKLESSKGAYVLAITADGSTDDIPNWGKVVKNCKGSVRAAVVACGNDAAPTDAEAAALCDRLRSEGSFLVAVPYSARSLDATFAREEADKAYHAAIDSLPQMVGVVSDSTIDRFIMAAYKNSRLAVLFVTNKEAPTAFMKDLAVTVQDLAETAMLSGPSQQTLERLKIPKTPSIICTLPLAAQTQGADGTIAESLHIFPYTGPTDVADVALFVHALFQRSRFASARDEATSSQTAFGRGAATAASAYEQVTADNWDRLCPDGASAVCAIAMVSGEEDGEAQAAVLANVMKKLGPSASTAFRFMWADAACLQAFADALDVQPHKLPTVAAFSPLRLRSAQLIGTYDERNVKQFLEGVLHGSVVTGPLSQRPVPDAQCATQDGLEAEAAEEPEDVDDLLAEIRREEEAAKKRLQQELEEERKRKAQEEEEERKKAEAAASTAKKTKKSSKKKKSSSKKNSEL